MLGGFIHQVPKRRTMWRQSVGIIRIPHPPLRILPAKVTTRAEDHNVTCARSIKTHRHTAGKPMPPWPRNARLLLSLPAAVLACFHCSDPIKNPKSDAQKPTPKSASRADSPQGVRQEVDGPAPLGLFRLRLKGGEKGPPPALRILSSKFYITYEWTVNFGWGVLPLF